MDCKRILVVEDDAAIRRGLIDALSFAGYATLEASEGAAGLAAALESDCDLLLLDLVLPGRDGLAVLREIRALRRPLPVIVLTARGSEDDRVRGLALGADDYVVKPFSIKELLARIEAVLRRTPAATAGRPAARVRRRARPTSSGTRSRFDDGERCELSDRERQLLALSRLPCRPGRLARRAAGAGVGPESGGDHDQDDRHAHRAAAREASRRQGKPANRADGSRPGLHARRRKAADETPGVGLADLRPLRRARRGGDGPRWAARRLPSSAPRPRRAGRPRSKKTCNWRSGGWTRRLRP